MTVATVLYEDKMQVASGGAFPPHDLVLAMVADVVGQTVWELRKHIDKNPRNGVSKLIGDLKRTDLLAGNGILCVLVDRDRVAEHLGLPKNAPEDQITTEIQKRSDAPEKLGVYFLEPNMEGLIRSIEACAPDVSAPTVKDHNARDLFLNRAAFSLPATVRDCVKSKQSSLGALVAKLAERYRTLPSTRSTPPN